MNCPYAACTHPTDQALHTLAQAATMAPPSTRQAAAAEPHLRKLHRHLVVHRQELALARLDGRVAAGAALGLQEGEQRVER